MPSYLGNYKRAAKDRDTKILRAVESVILQTYEDWELLTIADGCSQTREILEKENYKDERIKGYLAPKDKLWGGMPRNIGIEKSTGDWIIYLDIDDWFGKDHIKIINEAIKQNQGFDWYYFDDIIIQKPYNKKEWVKRKCWIDRVGKCGTSNLCHKREMNARWGRPTYRHDWNFVMALKMESMNCKYIPCPEYYVGHIPNRYDV